MSTKTGQIVLLIIAFITGLIAGAVITVYMPAQNPLPKTSQVNPPSQSPIFATQIATIDGSIVKIDGSKLTIKNTKGQQEEFQASENLIVYKKDNPAQPIANTFSGTGAIESGQEGRLVLELKDGKYQVTSIIYSKLTSPKPETKPSTPSSTPR